MGHFYIGTNKDKLATLPVAEGPAGEYWQYAGLGSWSSYTISKKDDTYHLIFEGLYTGAGLAAMNNGPNLGSLEGDVIIANNKGAFHQQDVDSGCDVTLEFTSDTLASSVKGDCGFGLNVTADGDYIRVK